MLHARFGTYSAQTQCGVYWTKQASSTNAHAVIANGSQLHVAPECSMLVLVPTVRRLRMDCNGQNRLPLHMHT